MTIDACSNWDYRSNYSWGFRSLFCRTRNPWGRARRRNHRPGVQVLTPIFQLAVAIPMLAAGWRRLHDTGRPGWYLLLPAALSIVTMIMLFSGIAVFSVLEQGADDPEALRGPAALLGVTGLMVVAVLQLILLVHMIWWLSRPSQEGTNEYGPPVV